MYVLKSKQGFLGILSYGLDAKPAQVEVGYYDLSKSDLYESGYRKL